MNFMQGIDYLKMGYHMRRSSFKKGNWLYIGDDHKLMCLMTKQPAYLVADHFRAIDWEVTKVKKVTLKQKICYPDLTIIPHIRYQDLQLAISEFIHYINVSESWDTGSIKHKMNEIFGEDMVR